LKPYFIHDKKSRPAASTVLPGGGLADRMDWRQRQAVQAVQALQATARKAPSSATFAEGVLNGGLNAVNTSILGTKVFLTFAVCMAPPFFYCIRSYIHFVNARE
jgi:hypothetical protein